MSDIPQCPNFRENKGCNRSELVLAGESQSHWSFICRCCHLNWVVTKPSGRQKARYENHIKKMEQATERDRMEAKRSTKFVAPRGGWM